MKNIITALALTLSLSGCWKLNEAIARSAGSETSTSCAVAIKKDIARFGAPVRSIPTETGVLVVYDKGQSIEYRAPIHPNVCMTR